jgi:hypothetical protein
VPVRATREESAKKSPPPRELLKKNPLPKAGKFHGPKETVQEERVVRGHEFLEYIVITSTSPQPAR